MSDKKRTNKKKCPICQSTEHVFCTKTPQPKKDPSSPEEKLLRAIFGNR